MLIMKIESAGYITLNNKKGSGLQGKRGLFLKFRSWFLRSVRAVFTTLLFVIFSMVVQFPCPTFAGGQLVIGMPMWGGERTNMPELECFLNEAYSRISVDIRFKYAPGLRLRRELSMGKIDGLGAMLASLVEGVEHVYFSPPLFTSTAHHYLSSVHSDLVPRLPKVFKDMLKDGSGQQCYGKYSHFIPIKYRKE